MAWTTPRTWTAGETVTAAMLNEQLRDNMNALGAWTEYSPAWTAVTTPPSLGDGTLAGQWCRIGKIVFFSIQLTYGSTTTPGSGSWRFSLPTTARWTGHSGAGWLLDSGTQLYPLSIYMVSTTTVAGVNEGNTQTGVGHTMPITFAAGDKVYLSGFYSES